MHQNTTMQPERAPVRARTPWVRIEGQRLGHIPSFDGFRGLAVLVVVAVHTQLVDKILPGVPIIIDMFFVMSGFLITTLLLDEQSERNGISLRMFYTRRVLRLFPAMYAMIAVFVLAMGAVQLLSPSSLNEGHWWGLEALGAGLYSYHVAAAFFPSHIGGAIGHTWSLSVEEQFYFIWPAVFVLVLRGMSRFPSHERRVGADRWLVLGAAGFVVAMFAIRFAFQDMIVLRGAEVGWVDNDAVTAQGVAYRLAAVRPDMIVVGCLLAIGARHIPRPVPRHWLRLLGVTASACWVLFFAAMAGSGRVWGFDRFGGPLYQLAMLGIAAMTLDLFLRTDSRITRVLSWKPATKLGLRSYGIYLWHVVVLWLFLPVLNNLYGFRKLGLGVVLWTLGIAAGFLSFRFIEKPFLRLKARKYQRVSEKRDDTGDQSAPTELSASVDLRSTSLPVESPEAQEPVATTASAGAARGQEPDK